MLYEHDGRTPSIDPAATIAATATVCGDVTVDAGVTLLHGATVVAEGGSIRIGANTVVLENAVVRSTTRFATSIGANCLIGPGAHVVGCELADEVFVATGASVFHGARVGSESAVRINAIVHVMTVLPAKSSLPIGWVAIGDPAEILSPHDGERILERLQEIGFTAVAYDIPRDGDPVMPRICARLRDEYRSHARDVPVGP